MLKRTILVVEDDDMIRQLISLYLTNENYHVVEARDGVEAQELYLLEHPCLIILDLMLSAKSLTADKINGLNIGADNYLTKPFDPDELVAHVEALLRRVKHHRLTLTSNGLCMLPEKREVLLYERQIHLTKHEFDLLYVLMSNPNIVYTREQLVNELYQFDERDILDRTIDAHIKKLREKIEDIPSKPERIKTVRGMGDRFVHPKTNA